MREKAREKERGEGSMKGETNGKIKKETIGKCIILCIDTISTSAIIPSMDRAVSFVAGPTFC